MSNAKQQTQDQLALEYPREGVNFLVATPLKRGVSLLEINRDLISELYKSFGAVILRGFAPDLESFSRFSGQFMTRSFKNSSPGREVIDRNHNIQTVNLKAAPLPLHAELAHTFLKPEICWFYCVKSPKLKGETILCDGTEVPERLRPEILSLLLSKNLRYRREMTIEAFEALIEGWQSDWRKALEDPKSAGVFKLMPGSRFVPAALFKSRIGRACARLLKLKPDLIAQDSVLPCLHKPKFVEKLAFANFVIFSRIRNKSHHYPTFEDGSIISDELVLELKQVTDQLTSAIKWQDGDILMLDNTRFMHGRNEVEETADRTIYTRFGLTNIS